MIEIDLGERKFQLYSEIRAERDSWFECLKISWRNSKDVKASISRMPRNIARLQSVLENEGVGTIKSICTEEIADCTATFRMM